MKFWDSSAVVPLVLAEPTSIAMQSLRDSDPMMVAWWGTLVECASAIARRSREPGTDPALAQAGLERLREVQGQWQEVQPGEALRLRAMRLLRVHELSAADSLQLAAALAASRGSPETMEVVVLDERLARAARLEGFKVVAPAP